MNNTKWILAEDKVLRESMEAYPLDPHKGFEMAVAMLEHRNLAAVKGRWHKLKSMDNAVEASKAKAAEGQELDHIIVQGRLNFGAINLEGTFKIQGAFTVSPVKEQQ